MIPTCWAARSSFSPGSGSSGVSWRERDRRRRYRPRGVAGWPRPLPVAAPRLKSRPCGTS